MIRNLIKTDMRYFKDAAVDTLVPLDRSMLYREKQIRHRMGPKMRFHGRQALETIFSSFIPPIKQSSPAPLQIHATALPDYLLASKPWKWLLAQGKNREVQVKYIDTF
ncbi:MAG: hypothetical protein Q8O99_01295 [bacterium]|nr:hypothetical protein [bacterium]